MSRYSNDLRRLAIDMLKVKKKSFQEVSVTINVCTKTLRLWVDKNTEGTLLDTIPSTGRSRVYDYDGLKDFVEKYPDKMLYEIKNEFFGGKFSLSGIDKALKVMNFRLKKNYSSTKKEMKQKELHTD